MGNLIKYEIKGMLKQILGLIAVIIMVNLFLIYKSNKWQGSGVISFSISFSISLTIMSIIVVFIWNVKLFVSNLRNDTGYLLYSLPVSSDSLLASKIIISIMQQLVTLFISVMFIYFHISRVGQLDGNILKVMDSINSKYILFVAIYMFIIYIDILISIYFSVVLSKTAVKKKRKIAKVGEWIIFIVLWMGISKVTELIEVIFPKTIEIKMVHNSILGSSIFSHVNIAVFVFQIVIFAVLFMTTSYLIRNKMDV